MGNRAERVSQISMSFTTPITLATSLKTGIDLDDDVASGFAQHGTGDSLAHRVASEVVGIPKEEHEKGLIELSGRRETLGKTQNAFDAMRARVQALEMGKPVSRHWSWAKPGWRLSLTSGYGFSNR